MLQSMAGPGESWQFGDERDVEDHIADEWCKPEVGIAEPVNTPTIPPAATGPGPSQNDNPPARRNKTGGA